MLITIFTKYFYRNAPSLRLSFLLLAISTRLKSGLKIFFEPTALTYKLEKHKEQSQTFVSGKENC